MKRWSDMTESERLHHQAALQHDRAKLEYELQTYEGYMMRNPLSMHWWERIREHSLSKRRYELAFMIIADRICEDPRYWSGDCNILETAIILIDTGLKAAGNWPVNGTRCTAFLVPASALAPKEKP